MYRFLCGVSKFDPRRTGASESHARAAEAVRFIAQTDLPRASRAINAALQLDERDSWLHFLNGFVYHLQARQGDSQKNDLAIEGYRTALRLDPGNWIAQEFLGLAYLQRLLGLESGDALVYASIGTYLGSTNETPRCFVTRDKDFLKRVESVLGDLHCRGVLGFPAAVAALKAAA